MDTSNTALNTSIESSIKELSLLGFAQDSRYLDYKDMTRVQAMFYLQILTTLLYKCKKVVR